MRRPRTALFVASLACTACVSRSDLFNGLPQGALLVQAVYPSHASWTAYVRFSDMSAGRFHQADVACDAALDGGSGKPDNCIHGGEARTVRVVGHTSCSEVSIVDDLGAFSWVCEPNLAEGALDFFSQGLASGRGLRDLLSEGGFRPNFVTATDSASGAVIGKSDALVWDWQNAITTLPANATGPAIALATPGTVYVLPASAATNGYNLAADHLSVVTLGEAELTHGDGASPVCAAGELATTGEKSLLCSGANHFLWIETHSRAVTADALEAHVSLVDTRFVRLNAIAVDGNQGASAIHCLRCANVQMTDLAIANTAHLGLSLEASSFGAVRRLLVQNTGGAAVSVSAGSTWNVLGDVTAIGNGAVDASVGVLVTDATTAFNKLHDVRVVNAGTYGIRIYAEAHDNWVLRFEAHAQSGALDPVGIGISGPRNHLAYGKVTNNIGWGARVQYWLGANSYDTTVVGLLSAANGSVGVYLQDMAIGSTVSHVTTVQNDAEGVAVLSADALTLANLLSVANGTNGLALFGDSDSGDLVRNVTRDVMVVDNALGGAVTEQLQSYFTAGWGSLNRFDGGLWVSGANPCKSNAAVSGQGLVDSTCTSTGSEGSSTYGAELSTAVLHHVGSAASSFVGQVTSDDSVNAADTSGAAAAGALNGAALFSFENPWRSWGKDAGAFPSSAGLGRCATGTCRIWDWRLAATDTLARERFGRLTAGATCPASVQGDVTVDDQQNAAWFPGTVAIERAGDAIGDDDGVCESGESCFNRFLAHAMEVVLDDSGDDDGLCEANEACIFAPNLGAYQGEGDFTGSPCVFEDGAATGVRGVTMFGYPQNGG